MMTKLSIALTYFYSR